MSDMISRQAVLKLLSTMPQEEAITKAMLIQSVRQMDSETVTECNDLISRREALKALKKNRFPGAHYIDTGVKIALREIKALPSAQPERKRGKWIPVTNGRGGHECSLCHTYAPSYASGNEWLTDYCPNCGACMREVDDGRPD